MEALLEETKGFLSLHRKFQSWGNLWASLLNLQICPPPSCSASQMSLPSVPSDYRPAFCAPVTLPLYFPHYPQPHTGFFHKLSFGHP